MKINEKIRSLREEHDFSQEYMAEKMAISTNTYGKLERGETRLTIDKLEKIASILGMDLIDLIQEEDKNIAYQINNNSSAINAVTITGGVEELRSMLNENEKLQIIISHKQEIIDKQKQEISLLKEMLELLKK